MSKADTVLEDGLRTELMLQLHLKALRKTLKQQLQETERRQTEELERRIYQNALLSAGVDGKSGDVEESNHKPKLVGIRRSTSLSALTSDKETSHRPPAWVTSTISTHSPVRAQQCERFALTKTTQQSKEEEAEAECQKKFCAVPVPSHVIQPIYQEMMELRERERKQGREQRMQFLLSIQRPFTFQEREEKKRNKLITALNQVSQYPKNSVCVRENPHKDLKDTPDLKARREYPARTGRPKLRTAERTREKKLGFLDEEPSFQPKILHRVPDFSRLHKALQTEALGRVQSKDVTKCQPFFLRTSAIPARRGMKSPETSQVPKINNLIRSKSLGALTLMSADTLPTYITDAVRKRCMAIRNSMETRESKTQESMDWLRNYQMKSQGIKKAVVLHAKLLDPHSSLKEVYNENLQRHREADQQRMRDYMRELRDMKARVSERPYLFEQVKQRNEKARAEQTYRSRLMRVGLKERFVEETGEALRSDDETETNDSSSGSYIQSREENVDDGEKIEDVEEKSVKSKGEETP
ncbi:protein FAM161B [Leuresthes tenuis]|uniref:protein FAM161B n=1 Tax=Leuresthes tenuis TaxID=355514 RepID=UPI003B500F6C